MKGREIIQYQLTDTEGFYRRTGCLGGGFPSAFRFLTNNYHLKILLKEITNMENTNKIYKVETFKELFFSKTKRAKPIQYYANEEGCYICTSHSPNRKNGYPRISSNGKRWRIARYIETLRRGTLPNGIVVRHICDNPLCINPDHLKIGTHADNMQDKLERGRMPLGEEHPFSKLKTHDIKIIRNSDISNTELARIFGVSKSTISSVRKYKTWKHVRA